MTPKRKPRHFDFQVQLTRAFFFINTLIWVGFSVYIFKDMTALNTTNKSAAVIVSLFMLVNAGALFFSGIMLPKKIKWTYYFAIAFLLINIFLTFANQFGAFDFVALAIDFVLLLMLVSLRKAFR